MKFLWTKPITPYPKTFNNRSMPCQIVCCAFYLNSRRMIEKPLRFATLKVCHSTSTQTVWG